MEIISKLFSDYLSIQNIASAPEYSVLNNVKKYYSGWSAIKYTKTK